MSSNQIMVAESAKRDKIIDSAKIATEDLPFLLCKPLDSPLKTSNLSR